MADATRSTQEYVEWITEGSPNIQVRSTQEYVEWICRGSGARLVRSTQEYVEWIVDSQAAPTPAAGPGRMIAVPS